jgi:hypothetical protein
MGASRLRVESRSRARRRGAIALVVLTAIAVALAACDSVLGLGDYYRVDCSFECDSGTAAEGGIVDATTDVFDAAALDAGDAAADANEDAATDAQPPSDASFEASPVTLWARWRMPNPDAPIAPDAAIAPDGAGLLPNQMTYDAGADGGSPTVLDVVTGLTWWREPVSVSSGMFNPATACIGNGVPSGFQVPTRIQLVSLIDFTQLPTIDLGAFPGMMGKGTAFGTASTTNVANAGSPYWTVNFSSGLTSYIEPPSYVLCVKAP